MEPSARHFVRDPTRANPGPLKRKHMAKASIHIKACSIARSEAHNQRKKELDYIRKDLSHLNESHFFDKTPLAKLKKQIAKEVKEKTGRAMQKNAVPIHEAVAIIEEGTSMQELIGFCQKIKDRWGITPLQIHVHRDEGHMRSAAVRKWRKDPDNNPWKPNLHAHIVWRSVRDDGKAVRLSSADCEEMQTLYAEVMGMERGKRTGRKGLSAMEFKIKAKEQEIAELEELCASQEATISTQVSEIDTLRQQITDKEHELEKMKSDKSRIEKACQTAQEKAEKAEMKRLEAERQVEELQESIRKETEIKEKVTFEVMEKQMEAANLDSDIETKNADIRKLEETTREMSEDVTAARDTIAKANAVASEIDSAKETLSVLHGDIEVAQKRKEIQNKATLIMEQDAKSLHNAKWEVREAIENIKTNGIFTSDETKRERENFKRSALDHLNDWESKRSLSDENKRLETEWSKEGQRRRNAEHNSELQRQTDKDLRELYPEMAVKLDEMNDLGLNGDQKHALLNGETIKARKKWYDKERRKDTDELEAVLNISDGHVKMNGGGIKAFFANFWASVAQAAHRAIAAFKGKLGLRADDISMTLTKNFNGHFISGDVNGTPLATKQVPDETGRSLSSMLRESTQMNEKALRLAILEKLYTVEELRAADQGIRPYTGETLAKGKGLKPSF